MKLKITASLIAVLVVGVLVFFYQTRPIVAPTTDIDSQVDRLPEPAEEQGQVWRIVGSESTASFSLGELLNDQPVTVVGQTSAIAGDINLSMTPAKMNLGEIKVDARTFKTDNQRRDSAIVRSILKAETPGNEYISFRANPISGLPGEIKAGDSFAHQISGDLVISGVSRPATFMATSTVAADGLSLSIQAETIITYGDFGITVPSLPFLAEVDKETKLSVFLVAR